MKLAGYPRQREKLFPKFQNFHPFAISHSFT
jgi:hypothetical protein